MSTTITPSVLSSRIDDRIACAERLKDAAERDVDLHTILYIAMQTLNACRQEMNAYQSLLRDVLNIDVDWDDVVGRGDNYPEEYLEVLGTSDSDG